ncbi:SDR family NAD(P)-dependent oxidoreductase [Streptomyces sp. NPDC048392]|uniref:SDR family NAD(P)-dependent oxidoreductase n=1 Tax=Streptomyces sp. NPDC048392 TaxID=3365543 RepID=UPI003717470D
MAGDGVDAVGQLRVTGGEVVARAGQRADEPGGVVVAQRLQEGGARLGRETGEGGDLAGELAQVAGSAARPGVDGAVGGTAVPGIEGNGGGAVLNVLSVLSWLHPAGLGAYAAAKAAAWALTDAAREELAPRGISVSALHVGYVDTAMASAVPADQKTGPAHVAAQALDGIERGLPEILADDVTRLVKQGLATAPAGA